MGLRGSLSVIICAERAATISFELQRLTTKCPAVMRSLVGQSMADVFGGQCNTSNKSDAKAGMRATSRLPRHCRRPPMCAPIFLQLVQAARDFADDSDNDDLTAYRV